MGEGRGGGLTLLTMESFSQRLSLNPSWEADLDESGCNSPAASVTHTPPLMDYPFRGQTLTEGGKEGGRGGRARTIGDVLSGLVDAGLGRVRGDLLFGTVVKRSAKGGMFAFLLICVFVFDESSAKCGREARFILESKLSKQDRPPVPTLSLTRMSMVRDYTIPLRFNHTLVILPDAEEPTHARGCLKECRNRGRTPLCQVSDLGCVKKRTVAKR